MEFNDRRNYSVKDVQKAGYTLSPMKCKSCGSNEVTYNQGVGDAYCADCGNWQTELKKKGK